jgi:NADPH:quinone reductase-like Zn-dependent oxidoreductase
VKNLYKAAPKEEFVPGLELSGVVCAVPPTQMADADGAADDTASDAALRRRKAQPVRKSPRRAAPAATAATAAPASKDEQRAFRVGDEVMAVVRFGAFASVVNVDVRAVRRVPRGWSLEQGSGFLAQAATAYYGLCELGNLGRKGVLQPRTVLVHSGAGGVGLFSIWIARRLGAAVVATVGRADKVAQLCELTGLAPADVIVRSTAARFAVDLRAWLDARRCDSRMSAVTLGAER